MAAGRRTPLSSVLVWLVLLTCVWVQQRAPHTELQDAFALGAAQSLAPRSIETQLRTVRAAMPVGNAELDAAVQTSLAFDPTSMEAVSSSIATAFADQGFNINGILFQASLPFYLLFLYFLSFRRNNTPPLAWFGFAFLLVFVFCTIPAGIISKTAFGVNLADADWLHGSAESLLTCTNIFIVLGFSAAMTGNQALAASEAPKGFAGSWFVIVVLTLLLGVPLGLGVHSPFLADGGALAELSASGAEPANALSLPTWLVHWSTVLEWLVAMSLVWRYAEATGNEKWKGLAWGMYLSHASSVFAITYHIFYNQIGWILTGQALCTCLGNATLMLAAYRIAASNGWTLDELNPFAEKEEADAVFDVSRLTLPAEQDQPFVTVCKLLIPTIIGSYVTKYGELFVAADVFRSEQSSLAAAALVVALTSGVVYTFYKNSEDLQKGQVPTIV
mmetsp:Transcript_6369/g.13955  ORF Transcript_6369/g.13955 Transcript_6369/m.13955 type:complete len:446 (-) Transcript_6369:69-1406(-)